MSVTVRFHCRLCESDSTAIPVWVELEETSFWGGTCHTCGEFTSHRTSVDGALALLGVGVKPFEVWEVEVDMLALELLERLE